MSFERLETRIPYVKKELVRRAAEYLGLSLSDFVNTRVEQAARETIERYEGFRLSRRDQEAFVDALLNPPSPNKKLKKAYKKYKKETGI